jgi:GGDEF domain-containing protein
LRRYITIFEINKFNGGELKMGSDDYIEGLFEKMPLKDSFWFVPDKEEDKKLEELFIYVIKNGKRKPLDVLARDVVKKATEMSIKGFFDKRFNLPGRSYLKHEIMVTFSRVVRRAKGEDGKLKMKRVDFFGKKFAIFIFDAEGLKAVNDNLSHSLGDIYLRLLASKIFPSRNKKLAVFLEQHNLSCFEATAGGDEMALIIYFDNWEEEVEQSIFSFNKNGQRSDLALEILNIVENDLGKTDVLKELKISIDFFRKKLAEKGVKIDIHDDFIWKVAAPGSYCTLLKKDWIEHFNSSFESDDKKEEKAAIYRIMDAIFTSIEKPLKRRKIAFKEGLRTSENLDDQVAYKITVRNEETRRLLDELEKKDRMICKRNLVISQLVKKIKKRGRKNGKERI